MPDADADDKYTGYEMKSIVHEYEDEKKEFAPRSVTRFREVDDEAEPVEGGDVYFMGECQIIASNGQSSQKIPLTFDIDDVDSFKEAFDVFEACAKSEVKRVKQQLMKQQRQAQLQAKQMRIRQQIQGSMRQGKDLKNETPPNILTPKDFS